MRWIRDPAGWVLGAFAVLWAATWWDPQWPVEQALHNALTVVTLALAVSAAAVAAAGSVLAYRYGVPVPVTVR